jgi:hypothetical protein
MKRNKPASAENSYLEAAIAFQRASDCHEGARASNKAHDAFIRAAKEIRKSVDRGRAFLLGLTRHPAPHVRAWAAVHLLTVDEPIALQILQDLAAGPASDVRFDAEMTLKEWKSCRLDPDWFMKEKRTKRLENLEKRIGKV